MGAGSPRVVFVTELTMPIRLRPRVLERPRDSVVVVTGGPPAGGGEYAQAARDLAVAIGGASVIAAVAGRRLAPELAGAGVVVPALAPGLLAPLASLCDWLGIAYAGCSPRAATLATDPALAAAVLQAAGITVASGVAIDRCAARGMDYLDPVRIRSAGAPAPHGHRIAATAQQLRAGLAAALAGGDQAWVEELVEGYAVSVPIVRTRTGDLLSGAAHDLAPGARFALDRPVAQSGAYVPADLDARAQSRIQRAAEAAYRALGLSGIASIEVVDDGDRSVVGMIDPAPVLTRSGLVVAQFAAIGLGPAELAAVLLSAARPGLRTAY